jgi:hypothetical protein
MPKMTFYRLTPDKQVVEDSEFEVQFNPTEYGLSKSAQFAEVAIPSLDSPVLQFLRGESERLSLSLFFDGTNKAVDDYQAVNERVQNFYKLVKVDGDQHAPPICRVIWGDDFPMLTNAEDNANQPVFDGVVESIDRQYVLFDEDGVPLRATVSLTMREYKTLEEQLQELNLRTADHTRMHIVRQGDTLPQIAYDYYQDASLWRFIAESNDIRNPRRLQPGTTLILDARV